MSTIPTTLNADSIPYTVVGGGRLSSCSENLPVSVLLLNRGNRLYRNEVFKELDKIGFESIVSVEEGGETLDIEGLSARYPRVRFLLMSEPGNPGQMINIGMRESCGPYVFVLWSDMGLSSQGLSSRFFERLAERDILCHAPFLSSREGELLPAAAAPALQKSSLKVLALPPSRDAAKTLFPFDYCGIYSRARFVLSGGFDGGLDNPYWQRLDFGFRAWLWGEEIRLAQALKVAYTENSPVENRTADECYKWFWLKNIAPAFRGDSALVPASRFWSYLGKRGGGVPAALREFRNARAWVRLNRYRFTNDAAGVIDLWEEGEA